jgi:hypothetical protein
VAFRINEVAGGGKIFFFFQKCPTSNS